MAQLSQRQNPAPPTIAKSQVPQPGNLHNALIQSHIQGADSIMKRNYDTPVCRKEISNTVDETNEKTKKHVSDEET